MSWQSEAGCLDADPRLFYSADGEPLPERREREAIALAVCRRCVVLAACRQHAVAMPERWGVWGGLTEDQRRVRARLGHWAA